jgi:hypothetical protein
MTVTSDNDFGGIPDQVYLPNAYLPNAIEIVRPSSPGYAAAGNHDGLCESGEACLYAPNFGGYQGDGPLEPCNFKGGVVTGVTMYGHARNGRSQ